MDCLKIDNNFPKTEASLELYFFQNIAPKIDVACTNKIKTPLINDPGYTKFSEDNISSAIAGIKSTKNKDTLDKVIGKVKEEISSNINIQNDLKEIAKDFKSTVIKQIGVERYERASNLIKEDLALNYIKRRVSEMTLNKFIKNFSPKTSAEYIIRRLNNESLFSLVGELTGQKSNTQLEEFIEDKAIKGYSPSEKEKAIAALSVTLFDAISLSPGSFTGAATSAIGDSAINISKEITSKVSKREDENLTADEYLSLVVFNSKENIFSKIRAKAYKEAPTMDFSLLNSRLQNKISISNFKPLEFKEKVDFLNTDILGLNSKKETSSNDIPSVIALEGQEEYLKEKKEEEKKVLDFLNDNKEKEFIDDNGAIIKLKRIENNKVKYSYKTEGETQEKELSLFNAYSNIKNSVWVPKEDTTIKEDLNNTSFLNPQKDSSEYLSWDKILNSLGFNGTESTIHNLPYVLATLPDELLGLFTGKSNALKLKNDILPLALMAIGIFIKNPILKMLLLVGGGLNLFNKVGKETLTQADSKYGNNTSQFIKEYQDEELSFRLKEPTIKGNKFTVILDGVPRFAILPGNVERAYKEGKLPLNTLANALLKEFDKKVAMGYKEKETILANENIDTKEKENISLSR